MKLWTKLALVAATIISVPSVLAGEFYGIVPGQDIDLALDHLNQVKRFEGGIYDEAWAGVVPGSDAQVILGATAGKIAMIQITVPQSVTLADRSDIRSLEKRYELPAGSRVDSECGAELGSLQCTLIYYECTPEPPACNYTLTSVRGSQTHWTKIGWKSAP